VHCSDHIFSAPRFEPDDYPSSSSKKRHRHHDDECFVCRDGGELLECDKCPKVRHYYQRAACLFD
jgi:hypothetical protein